MRTMSKPNHEQFLRRAIELAELAGVEYATGGPFGAVVVRDNKIIAEGMNRVLASHDPTWHGEIEAIRLACITSRSHELPGCTLYTISEPCPMCVAAAYWAKIDQIYYSATVEDTLNYGGYDNRWLYKELGLPSEKRRLPLTRLPLEEAIAVLKKFQTKLQPNGGKA
jgi:tRNA(Arg) A34 adenosine deaminase TadA